MLPSRACLQTEAAFLVLSQSLSPFESAPRRVCSGDQANLMIMGKVRD